MSSGDTAEPIRFLRFAELVREIANKSKPKSITERKAAGRHSTKTQFPALDVFKDFSRELQASFVPPGTTSIIFRFLFPEEDHKRKFGLRDKSLVREIADSLGLSEETYDQQDDIAGCPGDRVRRFLAQRHSPDEDYRGDLNIFEVNALLDQLASTSPWSHSDYSKKNLSRASTKSLLTRRDILKSLYRRMIPCEAAVLTQIILKDLRGLLYPQIETDPTAALRDYNTKAVKILTKENAMFAWDPTNRMNRSYRARWDIDAAAKAFESGKEVGPRPGTQIGVPKSQKGRSCKHALGFFAESSQVWAETKYDGERAQIHVQVTPGQKPRITIFSKSKRDSTGDRRAVHEVILACLGLDGRAGVNPRIQSNVILDAEMIPFEKTKILEFWRIRRLIRGTAVGIRGSRRWTRDVDESQEDEEDRQSDHDSESSLTSHAEGQHLGLVFFDVMYRDGESLVQTPYHRRCEILEELIITEPGKAILAERWPIDLTGHSQDTLSYADGASVNDSEESAGENEDEVSHARRTLHTLFAKCIALGGEGLVLKAANSEYNEMKKPWVKLKKDYIEGLGDNVDLVLLGAACVHDRALELRVPPTTLTTFYIGAQTNKAETVNNPEAPPHFYVYFTASYGLSRAELEQLNFLLKNDNPIPCSAKNMPYEGLKYTYTMYEKLPVPQLMLREPIAVELYGDRFTVSEGSKQYELRWPRITKYYRRHERTWSDCMTLQELREQAREAMGRVAAKEAARREAETTFKHPDARLDSDVVHRPDDMFKKVELWRAKVAEADIPKRNRRAPSKGGTNKGKGKKTSPKKAVLGKRRASVLCDASGAPPRKRMADEMAIPSSLAEWSTSLRSLAPLKVSTETHHELGLPLSKGHELPVLSPVPGNCGVVVPSSKSKNTEPIPLQITTNTIRSPSHTKAAGMPFSSAMDQNSPSQKNKSQSSPPTSAHSRIPASQSSVPKCRQYPSPPSSSPVKSQLDGDAESSPSVVSPPSVHPFFKNALFWVPPRKKGQCSNPSIKTIVDSGMRVHWLDAFLGACRWNPRGYQPVEPPPPRGVIFLDLEDEWGPVYERKVLDSVKRLDPQWRRTDEPRVSVWIFSRRCTKQERTLGRKPSRCSGENENYIYY
ncbi:hypothetical protein EV361DRAFT_829385 [Lentinula raphanica]|nr:hypothetical protein EV361DRAFT_829385 [Lentinula raphanica]